MNYTRRIAQSLMALVFLSIPSMAIAQSDAAALHTVQDSSHYWQDLGLDEVVVTGTRTEKSIANTPILTRVVTAKQIKENDFENIVDALEANIPGLYFRQDGRGNNICVQGLENKYVLMLVDGERLSSTPGGNIDFDRLNLSNVKQIEIIKGASSVLYGSNAIGMIINIITERPKRAMEGWAKLRYARFNELNTDAGIGFAHAGFSSLSSFYRKSDDGYNLHPEDQQSYTKNPTTNYKFEEKLAWDLGNTRLSAFGTLYFGEEFNPPQSIKNTHYKSDNKTAGASVEQILAPTHKVKLTYFGDFYTRKTVKQKENEVFKNASSALQSLQIIDQYSPLEELELVGGAEFNWNKDFSEMQFGQTEKSRQVQDINAFAQGDWLLLTTLKLTAGARYTHHSAFGNAFTPKLNLMYSSDAWRLRAGYSRGFKAPSVTELYSDFMMGSVSHNIGNPNLKAEKSNYIYLSAEYRKPLFAASTEIYMNGIKNKIQASFVQVNNADGTTHTELRYANVDDVRIGGFQLMGDYYPIRQIALHLGYAYTDARDLKTNLQLTGNSLHALNWMISYKEQLFKRDASISLSGHWTSERINDREQQTVNAATGEVETTISKNPQAAFALWRLAAQYTPWVRNQMRLTLTLGVQNIFNFTDPDHYTTFDPGRRLSASLMLRF